MDLMKMAELWTVRTEYDPESPLGQHCLMFPLGKEPLVHETQFAHQIQARKAGLHACCLGASVKVTVYKPDGTVAYSWDRKDNYWRGEDIPLEV